MGYWTKKTQEEIDKAVKNRDYTGGYEFWPWLWYMRKGYILGFLGNLVGGIISFTIFFKEYLQYGFSGDTWVGLAAGCFFGVFAPFLIGFLLRRDYKDGKQGFSR